MLVLISIFCGFLFSLVSYASLETQYVLTLPGGSPPKYAKNFSHLKYVNPHAPKGGKITLKTQNRGETLNPFKGALTSAPGLDLTFATLLTSPIDDFQNVYGYVAKSFDLYDTHVTFHLRPTASFHDGTPILPEDIIFSLNFFSTHANPVYQTLYQDISHGEKMGPLSVRFYFKEGNPKIHTANLGKMPILSHKDPMDCRKEYLDMPLLGSGPYKIKNHIFGNTTQYSRVRDWWGANLPIHKGLYNFDEIDYLYFASPTTAFEAFKKGDYDLRVENRASFWEKNYDSEAVESGNILKKIFKKADLHGFNALFINTRRPHLQNPKVRLALNVLLDFKLMNKMLFYGHYKRNMSVFMNTGFGGDHPETLLEKKLAHKLKISPFDLVSTTTYLNHEGTIREHKRQAIKLFKEAGWVIHQGQLIHHKTKEPFGLEILTRHQGEARILEYYAKTLKEIGIKVHIRLLPAPTYLRRLHIFDYDIILEYLPPMVTPGAELKNFWGSESANTPGNYNFAGVKDIQADLLIDQILKEKDPKVIRALSSLLDRLLFKGAYFIPMWYRDQAFVAFWDKFSYPKSAHKLGFTIHSWWGK